MWEDEVRAEINKIGIDYITAKQFARIAGELEITVLSVVWVHSNMLKEQRDTALPAGRPKTTEDKMFKK